MRDHPVLWGARAHDAQVHGLQDRQATRYATGLVHRQRGRRDLGALYAPSWLLARLTRCGTAAVRRWAGL